MKKLFCILLVLGLTIITSGYLSAASASTVYTSEADFVAALDSYYLEDFDNISMTGSEGPALLEMGPVNGFSYTMKVNDSYLYYCDGAMSAWNDTDAITVEFTGDSVTAFGGIFWPTDVNTNGLQGDVTVEISFVDGSTYSYLIEDADASTFTGFTSSVAISSFTFDDTMSEYPTVDHLYAGSAAPVPIPGALYLLGSGLLGMVFCRRKQ